MFEWEDDLMWENKPQYTLMRFDVLTDFSTKLVLIAKKRFVTLILNVFSIKFFFAPQGA